jgi:hypothetical protein
MLTIKLGTELLNNQIKKYILNNNEKLLHISRRSDPINGTQELMLEVR